MAELKGGRIEAFGLSDTGRIRPHNEDAFFVDARKGLFMVADGMGGHAAGEVASAQAIETVSTALLAAPAEGDPLGVVAAAVQSANQTINAANRERDLREGRGMGTTLTGFWRPPHLLKQRQGVAFHVGDSRLYRFRSSGEGVGGLEQLTGDHTLYAEWLEGGRRGPAPSRNVILQALGPHPDLSPDLSLIDLQPGDGVLLCSDGLTGHVSDEEISRLFAAGGPWGDASLEAMAADLIHRANQRGGEDNITAVLAWIIT